MDVKRCPSCAETKTRAEFGPSGGRTYCRPCTNAKNRKYKAAVPRSRYAAADRAWNDANPDRVKARWRRYRENHPDQRAAYKDAHVERTVAYRAKAKAKCRGAVQLETILFADLIARDGTNCHWCGRPLERQDMTYEHLIPIKRGGQHTRANLVLSCLFDNQSRNARLAGEWKRAAAG
jgi:5-methylcytosine-specific restriction endonuclease McrA